MGDELLVSSLVVSLFDQLNDLSLRASSEIIQARGVKGELQRLQLTLTIIQSVLEDAETKQVEVKAVRPWLRKLKGVALNAHNILDEFQTEVLRQRIDMIRNHKKAKVRNLFFSISKSFIFRQKMIRKIKGLNLALEQIRQTKDLFHFNEIKMVHKISNDVFITPEKVRKTKVTMISQFRKRNINDCLEEVAVEKREDRETHAVRDYLNVVGREHDKSKILEMLVITQSNNQQTAAAAAAAVSVLLIVGKGGIGKTTLTQLVYNDKLIFEHFELRTWVCVPENFDIKTILRSILESLTARYIEVSSMDALAGMLRMEIRGKRFLLVLDNIVWNHELDHHKWEELMDLLQSNINGSKIIVTTRQQKVASIIKPSHLYRLRKLSANDCWSLFESRVFGRGGPEKTQKLEHIGRGIVKKCGGVPLTVKFIGSLMHSKTEERDWLSISKSKIWDLQEEQKQIMGVLKMCYDNLSRFVRQCFSYCSIFPKDFMIEKETLIKLWMAQGFLQPSNRSTLTMENLGDDYFNALSRASFFQDARMDGYGNTVLYKMHDIVHDFARYVGGLEYVVEVNNEDAAADRILKDTSDLLRDSFSDIRHLSFAALKLPSTITKLRTFILGPNSCPNLEKLGNALSSLKFVRVLDLSGEKAIKELPSSIGELVLLKYLDLSHTLVETLPDSITCLYNLQTLKLNGCERLRKLPEETRKLLSLRHLELYRNNLTEMPKEIGRLTDLQTLPVFIVGKDEEGRGLSELRALNIRGQLHIKQLQNVKDERHAAEALLKEKRDIEALEVSWDDDDHNEEDCRDVLEGLQPNPNLKCLTIHCFKGVKFPMWMNVWVLPNLVEITLINCRRCEHLPPLGELPCLKMLEIIRMDSIKCIGKEIYGHEGADQTARPVSFPSLRELIMDSMCNLEKWEEPLQSNSSFPSLERLMILRCPHFTLPPIFPSLTSLLLDDLLDLQPALSTSTMALRHLRIQRCSRLENIQFNQQQVLTSSLKTLEIIQCDNLTQVSNVQFLTSLQSLVIMHCPKLNCLPEGLGFLSSLNYLCIGDLDGALNFSLPDSLQILELIKWSKLESLPQQIQQLSTLQQLLIRDFENLLSLPEWLGDLVSVRRLEIYNCMKLICLPQSISCLTNLIKLKIILCPLLEERCARERGEEWSKIAHIPVVELSNPHDHPGPNQS